MVGELAVAPTHRQVGDDFVRLAVENDIGLDGSDLGQWACVKGLRGGGLGLDIREIAVKASDAAPGDLVTLGAVGNEVEAREGQAAGQRGGDAGAGWLGD